MSYFEDNAKALRSKRTVVIEALSSISNITCALPNGAFYAFPDVSKFFGMKTKEGTIVKDSLDICSELLR